MKRKNKKYIVEYVNGLNQSFQVLVSATNTINAEKEINQKHHDIKKIIQIYPTK